ncbi:MAG: YggS family pyridoxal phosphate-dependent enzyme [Acidobacteriota bacterium]|nr:YggS family pyridoxal phosphate-dependent enzyme [Acidobacteriota bacterium]
MAVVDVASNVLQLKQEIKSIALNCGRDPREVSLMAVTKTVSADIVGQAVAAGQALFGENRLQEAWRKIPQVKAPKSSWHLIGPLQSNKVRRAVEIFQVIQTLDRPKIARKINHYAHKMGKTLPVFVEVNIGDEPQKHGVLTKELPALIELVDTMPALRLEGLMTIPPRHEEAEESRPYFQRLAAILNEINLCRESPVKELSMGMSHDYRIAIEEGSTLLRIGTAIFGSRL